MADLFSDNLLFLTIPHYFDQFMVEAHGASTYLVLFYESKCTYKIYSHFKNEVIYYRYIFKFIE